MTDFINLVRDKLEAVESASQKLIEAKSRATETAISMFPEFTGSPVSAIEAVCQRLEELVRTGITGDIFDALKSSVDIPSEIYPSLKEACRKSNASVEHAISCHKRFGSPLPDLFHTDAIRSATNSLSEYRLLMESHRLKRLEKMSTHVELAIISEQEHLQHNRRALEECIVVVKNAFIESIENDYLRTNIDNYAPFELPEFRTELTSEREQLVQFWCRSNLDIDLDLEQAAAIACVDSNLLVTARAGSGKTTTLTARAAFLIKHCRVPANQLMLLVFNRSAAEEMRERLENLGCSVPHVMTFHALAYALVHPEQSLIFDSPDDSQPALSSVFQMVLNELLDDLDYDQQIRQIMIGHFKADWEQLTTSGLTLSRDDGLSFRRAIKSESLRGEYLKSYGEKVIANLLFEHGVPYNYERNHWWNGRNYKPDFTVAIGTGGVIIEYFGLVGDPEYDKEIEEKREYWKNRKDWILVEIFPNQIRSGEHQIREPILSPLRVLGLDCNKLSEEELWNQVRERFITRFAGMARNFVGRCRKSSLHPSDVARLITKHKHLNDVEKKFLDVSAVIHERYLNRLKETGEEDFDGLLERACIAVEDGQMVFDRKAGRGDFAAINYIMVDEFQDFAPLFMRLLSAAREHNLDMKMFCVGDDWQAINSFAGSTTEYFEDFENHMGISEKLMITSNYRSSPMIVEAGNRVMVNRGEPARAARQYTGEILFADLADFVPNDPEKHKYQGDSITPFARRLIADAMRRGHTITLLARRNRLPYYTGSTRSLEQLRNAWTKGFTEDEKSRIQVTTSHKYKGLQADTVVILDAVAGSYPLLHPDWVFTRLHGDTPQKLLEDERKLFYVALTRAKYRLVIVTGIDESPFLEGLVDNRINLDWNDYPPPSEQAFDRVFVKVYSRPEYGSQATFEVKEDLKADNFRYIGGELPYWTRSYSLENHTIDNVVEHMKKRRWSTEGNGLDVQLCDQDDQIVKRFHISMGSWSAMKP